MLRSRSGRLIRLILAISSMLLIAFYVIVAIVSGAEPPLKPFQGWIALVVPPTDTTDQVRLSVSPSVAGGSGQHPEVEYDISVCGTAPFTGMLLMGGAARLVGPQRTAQVSNAPTAVTTAVSAQHLSGLVGGPALENPIALGVIDALPVQLSGVVACAPEQAAATGFATGTPVTFSGRLREPVRRQFSLLGMHGPRQSQSWPLIGRFPGVSPILLGAFSIDGLPDEWMRARVLGVQVDVGTLTTKAAVEASSPQIVDTQSLDWRSQTPVAPFARLVDLDDQATWQETLVFASTLLGIAASVLAAMLLELGIRRRREAIDLDADGRPVIATPVGLPAADSRPQRRAIPPGTDRVAVALVAAIIILGRATKSRLGGLPRRSGR
jgi:hypothetical protein